ncbi:MAG: cell division ATP-binding protein FtsE, partial [Dermatophilaceae bacterium]
NRPQILLCDEPTGNLDQRISLEIVHLLDRINRTGTTVVLATHDQEIVNDMRRRVIQLDDGRLVRDEKGSGYHPSDPLDAHTPRHASSPYSSPLGPDGEPGPEAAVEADLTREL